MSAYNIKKALQAIGETDYTASLQKLAVKKWESLKGEQCLARQAKTAAFLLRKGYENGLVQQAIAKLKTTAEEQE
ncbi:MAG: hypothetical protein NVSMB63_08710 [Sediminibacterium sp.]